MTPLTKNQWQILFQLANPLTLVLSLVFFVGCIDSEEGFQRVNPGPEVPIALVELAINEKVHEQNPLSIQVGQFVHTEQTNEIAGGASRSIAAELGQTVIGKAESSTAVQFTVIETKVEVLQNEKPRATSVEEYYTFAKPQASTQIQPSQRQNWYAYILHQLRKLLPLDRVRVAVSRAVADGTDAKAEDSPLVLPKLADPLQRIRSLLAMQHPALKQASAQMAPLPETFHNLKTWTARESVPEMAKKRVGCGGSATCSMNVKYVQFDKVFRSGNTAERIHFDFALSSDVPYFATILQNCVTLMVPISQNSKTLLKQCFDVIDFRFQSAE